MSLFDIRIGCQCLCACYLSRKFAWRFCKIATRINSYEMQVELSTELVDLLLSRVVRLTSPWFNCCLHGAEPVVIH